MSREKDVIAFIMLSILFVIAAYFTYNNNIKILMNPCQIITFNNEIWRESLGRLYLEHNITINDNKHIILDCGRVKSFKNSSCNFKYEIGEQFYCYQDFRGQYHRDDYIISETILGVILTLLSGFCVANLFYLIIKQK